MSLEMLMGSSNIANGLERLFYSSASDAHQAPSLANIMQLFTLFLLSSRVGSLDMRPIAFQLPIIHTPLCLKGLL
jgi:hypothetical protein